MTFLPQRLRDLYVLRANLDAEIQRVERMAGVARRVARCGTDGGYYHHLRKRQEPACDLCKAAHTIANRERTRKAS